MALGTDATGARVPDPELGTVLWSRGVAITAIVVALLSPFLGALADRLRQSGERSLDIELAVKLKTAQMDEAETVARSNAKYLYWSPEQQLAHHTVNGCNARPGDLMASGTISGETEDSYGSFLELTWRGSRPIELPSGETRTFLADGDSVVLAGVAVRDGVRISFGEVEGTIAPAR